MNTDDKKLPGRTEPPTGHEDNNNCANVVESEAESNQLPLSEQAAEVIRQQGLRPVGPLQSDGLLHHADVEGDRPGSNHLWYVITHSPRPVLIFGDFKCRLPQNQIAVKLQSAGQEPSAAESAIWERAREAAKRAVEAQHRRAAQAVRCDLVALQDAANANSYLTRKQVTLCGGLKEDPQGRLLMPVYDAESGELISAQVIEGDGFKKFMPGCRTQGGMFVIGGRDDGARVPDNSETVFLVEGLATGLTVHAAMSGASVVVCFSAGNLMAVARTLAKTLTRQSQDKAGRLKARFCLCADNDRGAEAETGHNAGIEAGFQAAKRHGFHFASPEFSLAGDSSDFNDLFVEHLELAARAAGPSASSQDHRAAALAQVRQQIELALNRKPLCFTEDEAVEYLLDIKSEAEREREREEIAATMNVKGSWLKRAVAEGRKNRQEARKKAEPGGDDDLPFAQVKLHNELVDGAVALDEAVALINRHVTLPAYLADLAAIWSLGTHMVEDFEHYPRVHITSNSENSGKTTLGESMISLAARGFSTTSPSRAALLRDLGLKPTILLDEAENWLHLDEVYCAILNEGFRRDGNLRRCVEVVTKSGAKGYAVKSFPVYAPVILAGIGNLHRASLASRCLQFHLIPAPDHQQPVPFDDVSRKAAAVIAGKFARWAADNRERVRSALANANTSMGVNRNRQLAKPLLTIVQMLGSKWGERVKVALETLWSTDLPDPGLSMKLMLAVLDLFTAPDQVTGKPHSNRTPAELADGLVGLTDYAWASARRGEPIDADWVRTNLRREFRLSVRRCRRPESLVYAYPREDVLAIAQIYRDRLRDAARVLRLGTEGTLQELGLDSQPEAGE